MLDWAVAFGLLCFVFCLCLVLLLLGCIVWNGLQKLVPELLFILNLGILAVATIYVKLSGGSQAAVAYISVGIAFLTFVGIVTFHNYLRIKPKLQNMQCHHEMESAMKNGIIRAIYSISVRLLQILLLILKLIFVNCDLHSIPSKLLLKSC